MFEVCMFTKLSQIVCLINIHIYYINIPSETAGYGRFSDLFVCVFLGIFILCYVVHILNEPLPLFKICLLLIPNSNLFIYLYMYIGTYL